MPTATAEVRHQAPTEVPDMGSSAEDTGGGADDKDMGSPAEGTGDGPLGKERLPMPSTPPLRTCWRMYDTKRWSKCSSVHKK